MASFLKGKVVKKRIISSFEAQWVEGQILSKPSIRSSGSDEFLGLGHDLSDKGFCTEAGQPVHSRSRAWRLVRRYYIGWLRYLSDGGWGGRPKLEECHKTMVGPPTATTIRDPCHEEPSTKSYDPTL